MTTISAATNARHDQQPKLESPVSQSNLNVINECQSIILTGIGELLSLFFSQLDDDLFKLSEKAENNAKQTLLFETMRFFRREREAMRTKYIQNLSLNYDDYWKKTSPTLIVIDGGKNNNGDLSLIDDAVLEETLAVNGVIEKGNALYQAQLFPLNERFCWLSGKTSETEYLPVSPEVLCKEFSNVLGPMEVDLKVKLLVYKIFDHQILSKVGEVYQNLNSHLAANGVLPTISNKIGKQKSRDYTNESNPLAQTVSDDEMAEISAYMETFRTMQSLMDDWRLRLGMPSLPSMLPGAVIADSKSVINVIDCIQHSSVGDAVDSQPISAENLKQHVALQLGKVQGNHLGRTMGRPEEDVIDMVGVIFDFILDDKNVVPTIRGLIARLQIPIIKVAILDKTFFANKNHASRILLNDLAQAGMGLTAEEATADNPVVQKIEEVVTKIINDFSQNVGMFDELLKDFSTFMEKESKRGALAENRLLQTTQSKEKIWLAKKAVAAEIAKRLQNVDAPASFRTFVYNDWKDVLFLAFLRRDKNDGEWEQSLETLDKMIWSITPPANPQERTKLVRETPAITEAIREGLKNLSLDAHQIKSLLKELEICHMEALHPNALLRHSERSGQAKSADAALPTHDVEIRDAELAEAILEVKSHLPDISNIDVNEMIMGGVEAVSQKGTAGWLENFIKDKYWEAANRLKVGDWVELINEDRLVCQAKLAWKSPSTSLCVFVNRRGIKVLEIKLDEFTSRMRQGQANVIESANIPLMDRAVSFLTQSLQNPFAKSTESPSYA